MILRVKDGGARIACKAVSAQHTASGPAIGHQSSMRPQHGSLPQITAARLGFDHPII
jgi:hypothetical protein